MQTCMYNNISSEYVSYLFKTETSPSLAQSRQYTATKIKQNFTT